jgi:tRNA G37 N-methylase TrmD
MFQFDVVTLFPEMFVAITESGVTGRARERKGGRIAVASITWPRCRRPG